MSDVPDTTLEQLRKRARSLELQAVEIAARTQEVHALIQLLERSRPGRRAKVEVLRPEAHDDGRDFAEPGGGDTAA